MEKAENVKQDVELVDAPEVVVGLLPDHRVREDEHGADDGEEGDAREAGQRLEEPVRDGGLPIRRKVELSGEAVQVLYGLGAHVVKVDQMAWNGI